MLMTPREVMTRHLQYLLESEQQLMSEARRVESGLTAVRNQIAFERQALAAPSGSSGRTADRAAA